jgi:hypothetical protein
MKDAVMPMARVVNMLAGEAWPVAVYFSSIGAY